MKWLGCAIVLIGVAGCAREARDVEPRVEPEKVEQAQLGQQVTAPVRTPRRYNWPIIAHFPGLTSRHLSVPEAQGLYGAVQEFQLMLGIRATGAEPRVSGLMYANPPRHTLGFSLSEERHRYTITTNLDAKDPKVREYRNYFDSGNPYGTDEASLIKSKDELLQLGERLLPRINASRYGYEGRKWSVRQVNWRDTVPRYPINGRTLIEQRGVIYEVKSLVDLPIIERVRPTLHVSFEDQSGVVTQFEYRDCLVSMDEPKYDEEHCRKVAGEYLQAHSEVLPRNTRVSGVGEFAWVYRHAPELYSTNPDVPVARGFKFNTSAGGLWVTVDATSGKVSYDSQYLRARLNEHRYGR